MSRSGTLGVSETQDAIGPMARTVRDARALFEVMRGEDPEDPALSILKGCPLKRNHLPHLRGTAHSESES